ncbi:formimidoylglutamate deiminase [Pseudaquabacterium pictum]|uniref:Formimidoylglutamate deiminase n=1 Tax=Pseudaquabacterium pictum TaxID=2315236 RepID=A0A480AJD4_9BURK|nr:formimidoylglutamate deiminase [Rubrivivax pictus]GCL61764.1 formimidoylglutamate deiminase [Rubrivivax pictus]
MSTAQALWAPRAWIGGGWQARVLLEIDGQGHFSQVHAGMPAPQGATVLSGPVLPGLVNAHSHAFQRAFAGLAERRNGQDDDFWSWRDRMYAVALQVSPAALRAVAGQLYAELLQGGYTQVCEFHYLQHQPDGQPYPDRLTMCQALMQAAADTGIGLTLLPVLYERAGFQQPALRPDQRRFATTATDVLALRQGVLDAGQPLVSAGVAIHSLRAAQPAAIRQLQQALADVATPIHIHIAEQTAEVDDCLAATGQRPIDWLASHLPLDARWHLVHATHATPAEIDAVGRAGAGVVICPSTEANLGDGLVDLPRWLDSGALLSLGSDSHVSRQWPAELRLLEYGQRLALRQRNLGAAPQLGLDATAARLFDRHLAGGAAAAGFDCWGLAAGARADLLVLDGQADGLAGVPPSHALDALVFATDAPAFREVWVAGQRRVADGRHRQQAALRAAHAEAMARLWAAPD